MRVSDGPYAAKKSLQRASLGKIGRHEGQRTTAVSWKPEIGETSRGKGARGGPKDRVRPFYEVGDSPVSIRGIEALSARA